MLPRINIHNTIVQEKIIIQFLINKTNTNYMFLFRKRSNKLSIEEKQDLSTIEKEIEVYVESEYVDINKKIYQQLMEAKKK
jgi:hypothetical protein